MKFKKHYMSHNFFSISHISKNSYMMKYYLSYFGDSQLSTSCIGYTIITKIFEDCYSSSINERICTQIFIL